MVLRDGFSLAVLGISLGIGGAVLASPGVESLLYEVDPRDPGTLIASALFFLSIAGMASLLPGLGATKIDPTEALRSD